MLAQRLYDTFRDEIVSHGTEVEQEVCADIGRCNLDVEVLMAEKIKDWLSNTGVYEAGAKQADAS